MNLNWFFVFREHASSRWWQTLWFILVSFLSGHTSPSRYYTLFSWGYAFVSSQDIGIWCAYSAFADYFQISIQFGMKLCREFDCAIQTLYMKDYLQFPDEVDLHNINQLHHHVHGLDSMLCSLDCSHTIWKNCLKHGQVSIEEKKTTPLKCWRVFLIITCFCGMLLMNLYVPSMSQQCLTCHHFLAFFLWIRWYP